MNGAMKTQEISKSIMSDASRRIEKLREGKYIAGDFGLEIVKPPWFDEAKFTRGQKLSKDNLVCVFLADLLFLLTVFSSPRILRTLILTGKSSCPFTALNRYVATIRAVVSWHNGDIWNPEDLAHKFLRHVMTSHKSLYTIANFQRKEEVDRIEVEENPMVQITGMYKKIRASNEEQSRSTKCDGNAKNTNHITPKMKIQPDFDQAKERPRTSSNVQASIKKHNFSLSNDEFTPSKDTARKRSQQDHNPNFSSNYNQVPSSRNSDSKMSESVRSDKSPPKVDESIPNHNIPYVSQWDLLTVQYAFIASIVAHPEAFGAWNLPDEDVDGFIYYWKVLGFFLGIREEFNLCSGDLEQTRALILAFEQEVILPAFEEVDHNFEHMSLALMGGINMMVPLVNYPSALMYLLTALGADTATIYKSLTLREKAIYHFLNCVTYSCRVRLIRNMFSSLLEICLDLIEGHGPWWWPRILAPKNTISPRVP
ncbi:uncharacterized protein LOC108671550 [Hyalella azteca]|uniref:Uncharacterized protein LOC108671550 n=1 Tax=Hyalella azteca TaxID=294128 RepID=A0A8B7NLR7_HYAAZ|nr:uncharacterized protein LOC108671550 [Hyalella azteca]XP_018014606.1 uncharacterized protein LOC108671550 [Hyalella azteca]XP_018014614.1 uncharacterized protein LOC108671550 [Hyalella azteca]